MSERADNLYEVGGGVNSKYTSYLKIRMIESFYPNSLQYNDVKFICSEGSYMK